MKVLSVIGDKDKFNVEDLTRFEFDNKILDIHNLFFIEDILFENNSLVIRLKNNKYYNLLYKKRKGLKLSVIFSNFSLDKDFDTNFRVEEYENISLMSFTKSIQSYNKLISIDLLFNNNDFFKIYCKDCFFEFEEFENIHY